MKWIVQPLSTFPLMCLCGLSFAHAVLHLGWCHHHCHLCLLKVHTSFKVQCQVLSSMKPPWSSIMMWGPLPLNFMCHHFLWTKRFCFIIFQPLLDNNLLGPPCLLQCFPRVKCSISIVPWSKGSLGPKVHGKVSKMEMSLLRARHALVQHRVDVTPTSYPGLFCLHQGVKIHFVLCQQREWYLYPFLLRVGSLPNFFKSLFYSTVRHLFSSVPSRI